MIKVLGRALLLLAAFTAGPAVAQEYPSGSIRIIVPYPPGGTTDILSRIVGEKLSQAWGQAVIVDNRPGGNSIIATNAVAKATPDGHTIGMFLTTFAVTPHVTKDLPYDPMKELAPVSLVAIVPGILVTNKDIAASNLQDVIKMAKADPGKYNYGSPGPLTSGHLSMELLKRMAGIDVMHVPYRGGPPSVLGLMQNQVQFSIGGPPSLMPHIQSGAFKALAVTTAQRVPLFPEVPTLAEQGLAGYDTFEWYGLFAPGGTPKHVLDKLNREIARIIAMPDVQEKIAGQGAAPKTNSPDEFRGFVVSEMNKWKSLVEEMKIKAE
jgi:tripartite-type tricarboxylate transporter receptor subunit TctC